MIRDVSAAYTEDRALAKDVTRISAMIDGGMFCDWAASVLPSMSQ